MDSLQVHEQRIIKGEDKTMEQALQTKLTLENKSESNSQRGRGRGQRGRGGRNHTNQESPNNENAGENSS